MISTLEDLVKYTERRAAKSPAIAARVLLKSPGVARQERLKLEQQLPGLPASYLECAERFRLETVELGMVALRPRNFGGQGLAERLIVANGPSNPVADILRSHSLYEVASWETDPIGVVRVDAPAERRREVVLVDITSHPTISWSPLAPDFATFLVMAGRLYEAGHKGADVDELVGEVALDARQVESWRSLAGMVLD